MAVRHPDWGTICEICFCDVNEDTCVIDLDGIKWDVHSGMCAQQAGIPEIEIRANHICEYDKSIRHAGD